MPEDGPMAEDRKFHHPVPFEFFLLILVGTQVLAFGARFALQRWWSVPSEAWVAFALGGVMAVALVSTITMLRGKS